ncbi:MAG: DNA-binding response regulator [Verrucomicrobiaceae bacterium]|nr:DNA-binding response regulator [Verrucomicrobiaceae bacterium]
MQDPLAPVVHLIDDDSILLEVLSELVASINVKTVPYRSARAFLDSYKPAPCECVVSDIRMPEITGLELQRVVSNSYRVPPPIIFVTGYADVSAAVEAMKNGAYDFVEKPVSGAVFLEKINGALKLSRQLHTQRVDASVRSARIALLTPKEREVLQQLVKRQTNREMGETLGLSVRTIENHRAHILAKFRVKDTYELLALFTQPTPLDI